MILAMVVCTTCWLLSQMLLCRWTVLPGCLTGLTDNGCSRVPINARYIAQSMGLQISCTGDDVTAVLPLESGSNRLHCLIEL